MHYGWLVVVLCSASPALWGAEVYQWTDARGLVHFTDTPPPAGIVHQSKSISEQAPDYLYQSTDSEGQTHISDQAPLTPRYDTLSVESLPHVTVLPTQAGQSVTMPSVTPPAPVVSASESEQALTRQVQQLQRHCETLAYGSLARRECRSRAKQQFTQHCLDDKVEASLKRAYCWLMDSYQTVE